MEKMVYLYAHNRDYLIFCKTFSEPSSENVYDIPSPWTGYFVKYRRIFDPSISRDYHQAKLGDHFKTSPELGSGNVYDI